MLRVVICIFFVVYLYVNGSGSITSVGEERELIYLLLFTCHYVVSVWRGFLFLWVFGMGYVILLWHSLSLPYNYIGNILWLYSPVFVVIEPGGKLQNSYDLATSVRTYFRLCNHSMQPISFRL